MKDQEMKDVQDWAKRKSQGPLGPETPEEGGMPGDEMSPEDASGPVGGTSTLREHADTLTSMADQVALDAEGAGGLHDGPAKELVEALNNIRAAADAITKLCDEEDDLDIDGEDEMPEEEMPEEMGGEDEMPEEIEA